DAADLVGEEEGVLAARSVGGRSSGGFFLPGGAGVGGGALERRLLGVGGDPPPLPPPLRGGGGRRGGAAPGPGAGRGGGRGGRGRVGGVWSGAIMPLDVFMRWRRRQCSQGRGFGSASSGRRTSSWPHSMQRKVSFASSSRTAFTPAMSSAPDATSTSIAAVP